MVGGLESGAHPPQQEGSQGELKINLQVEPKVLSEQEVTIVANGVVREFGENIITTFYKTVREGRGKEILGNVSQRGDEKEIALESNIEHTFVNTCDANGLPVYIVGEHHEYKSPKSNGGNHNIEPKHIAFIDSLDDTREYEQGGQGSPGLPAPLWAAAFIYRLLDGKPVAGVIANLKEKYMYVSTDGKNYRKDLETGEEKEIKPSEKTSIKDKGFCLATYAGAPKYFHSFYENFSEVVETLEKDGDDAIIQPHTGNFIYGPMAEGTVDAYLIKREPASEKHAGWGFAKLAGFTAWEINPEDGSFEEVKHDLNHFKDNPDAYRAARMPYYLVTRSNQVRDEIIALVVKDHKEKKIREAEKLFAEAHRTEFEVFRASLQSPNHSSN